MSGCIGKRGSRIKVANASARTLDGIVFDSKAEMKRYAELKMLERAGVIWNLKRQDSYLLQEGFRHPEHGLQRPITYVSDFSYDDREGHIVEDCKGFRTEIYRLKKKLLLAKYPVIHFKEVRA